MEINSLQGATAYINAAASAPPADTTRVQDQNIQAANTELDTRETSAVRDAFNVTLSREAQNLQDENTVEQEAPAEPLETAPAPEPETENEQAASTYEASQIVNIVA